MKPVAFASPVLPTRGLPRSRASMNTPRCALPEVEQNYPEYLRNKAPHISFSGESGIFFSMERVKAFTEDTGEPPLFNYYEKNWSEDKPATPSPISWPSGDGRKVEMEGLISTFTQPNLREYGPFPDYLKRSCDL